MSIESNEGYKVARMGVEPMIFGMRIRRPRPLDERAVAIVYLIFTIYFNYNVAMNAQKKILLV